MIKKESTRTIKYSVSADSFDMRVSRFLKENNYPEGCISRLRHEEGTIRFNKEIVHMNFVFQSEGILEVLIHEKEISEKIIPVKMPIDIVYEDEDLIVVNKPAFMPIHPSLNNYTNTLANALAYYFEEKGEGIVFRCINRLDRDTTGLTIIAKHYLAGGILSEEMKNRRIHREYVGIVSGADIDDEGTVNAPIGRVDGSTIERTVDYQNGDRAITHYRVIARAGDCALVRFNLETGRTHQIRVHMKHIGHPLIGDFLYNPEDGRMERQALHGEHLVFSHPITGKTMDITAELPEDMRKFMEARK